MYSDDPIADFNAYDQECENWLASRPKCDWCGEHIQDDFAFEIGDDLVCDECIYACRTEIVGE